MAMQYPDYDFLMAVCDCDVPEWLALAIESMLAQTVPAHEIVIVQDGSISQELQAVLDGYAACNPQLFRFVRLAENKGLGYALKVGVEHCGSEFIARMDADDWSLPQRCQKELDCFLANPELSFVGSNIDEFSGSLNDVHSRALRPESHEGIVSYARRRNPMYHVTLMMRREDLLRMGNYKDFRRAQDYELVCRALQVGCKCRNIQEPLVKVRAEEDYYKRRGGMGYFKKLMAVKMEIRRDGFFTVGDLAIGAATAAVGSFVPTGPRTWMYKHLLREKVKGDNVV